MNRRLACSAGLAALVMASLAGCSTRDDPALDTIGQVSSLWTGSFTLRNYASGLCLGVSGGHSDYNTPVITWTCDGSTNQNWTVGSPMSDDPQYVQLINGILPGAQRCLNNAGYQGSNGNYYYPLLITSCRSSGDGYKPIFAFTSPSSNLDCYRFGWTVAHPPDYVVGTLDKLSKGAQAVVSIEPNDVTTHPDQFWCVPRGSLYY